MISIQWFTALTVAIGIIWLLSGVISWINPSRECSYVGQHGYVRWRRRKKVYYHEMVRFKDCSHNRFEQQSAENRGRYAGALRFGLFTLDGKRHVYETHIGFGAIGPYDMGLSIDLAWTKYLLRNARANIEAGGYFDVRASDDLTVRFFANYVELLIDGHSIKASRQDLALFRFAYDMNIKLFFREYIAPERSVEFLLPFNKIENYRAFLVLAGHVLDEKLEGKKFDSLPTWHFGTW